MSDINDLFFRKAEMADFDPIWEIIQQAKAQMRQLGTFQWDATYPLPDDIRRDIQEGVGYVMCVDKQVAVYGVISFKGEPVYEQIADSWSNALRCPSACSGRRDETAGLGQTIYAPGRGT